VRGQLIITLSSKMATPMPLAAPVPANPMKCPLPMLLANSDAPTYDHTRRSVSVSVCDWQTPTVNQLQTILTQTTSTMMYKLSFFI